MSEDIKSKALETQSLIDYQKDSVVSKEIIKKELGAVTVFAFDKGQGLSEHSAPFDAMVQIIDGEAEITISGVKHTVKAGEMIIMPADEPHALQAVNCPYKMILTMIFITIAFIFGMSTKVSALETRTIQLGETRVMTLNYMIASDNVYCIAHSKNLLGLEPAFQAIGYVDIKGDHAEGVTSSGQWLERNSPENAVLASILAGNLQKGYGKLINGQPYYYETQRALYGFWNKWVGSVGGQYGFMADSSNENIFNQVSNAQTLINQAKADAAKKDYEVRIYLLHTNSPANPQELILVERKSIPDDSDEPQPGQTTTTGYINISGYVWEDIANSKNNTNYGSY